MNQAWSARGAQWIVLALIVVLLPVTRPLPPTHVYAYDAPSVAQLEVRRSDAVETDANQSSERRGWSARSSVDAPGTSTTPDTQRYATKLDPGRIRFSQSSVNDVGEVASSMRANGWVGEPVDVVRMPDGGLTAVDNTRVLAAHEAGIPVQARINELRRPVAWFPS